MTHDRAEKEYHEETKTVTHKLSMVRGDRRVADRRLSTRNLDEKIPGIDLDQ